MIAWYRTRKIRGPCLGGSAIVEDLSAARLVPLGTVIRTAPHRSPTGPRVCGDGSHQHGQDLRPGVRGDEGPRDPGTDSMGRCRPLVVRYAAM